MYSRPWIVSTLNGNKYSLYQRYLLSNVISIILHVVQGQNNQYSLSIKEYLLTQVLTNRV